MSSKGTPQEIIVWYILPALRKALVLELKQLGMSQKAIADKMDITPAAVSQYVSNKRASKNILFNDYVKEEIQKSALLIKESDEEDRALRELVKLADLAKNEKIVCNSCKLKKSDCCLCMENTNRTTEEYIG